MKKVCMIAVMAAIICSAVYAYPVSMGGGLVFGGGTTSLDWDMNRFKTAQSTQGVSLFFDTKYAALFVDIMSGAWDLSGRYSPFVPPEEEPDPDTPSTDLVPKGDFSQYHIVKSYSTSVVDINLIFKFPLALYGLETVSIFPIVGGAYQISQIVEDATLVSGTYNEIRLLFGLGGDFDLSDRVYLRFMALPYYHLTKKTTTNIVKEVVDGPWGAHGGFGANGYIMAGFRFGHSPQSQTANTARANTPVNNATTNNPGNELIQLE